ncbi:thioredoxin family protein [Pelomonas sp. KK5]|uniref:thioredoxin family protein n=1 Tax=Pelomonas sp. KK5 TaxID=1855730 RepID=UPI00097CBA81|nr:thioredoxin family protein [Pelomonas sp. KK5]
MSPKLRILAASLALALAAAAPAAHAATSPASGGAAVAWLEANGDADVDRAFTQAKTEKKPLLLYWGAKWCPPCNQLKATLFNRQDFIEQSRAFVAVHIDGDSAGAQKLGTRFKVRGYPTMILFNPAATEITRLPGEIDAPQVVKVLQLGLAGGRPVKAVLADARAGKKLNANEWKLLAFYSWETDEQQLAPEQERANLLAQLARSSTGVDEETTTRLWLKALAASNEAQGVQPDAALQKRVEALLASPAQSRAMMDVLTNSAPELASVLAPDAGPARTKLVAAYDAALAKLETDASLSRADRITALQARVDLARLGQPKDAVNPKISPALQQAVREHAARDDKEITDGYERQAVITEAAYVLGLAGLWKDSDTLLKASLAKSHSPYYLMSYLGNNARKQGRKDEALQWYEQAFAKSEGPATRLQWGSNYLAALVDLAPQDSGKIEKTASQLFNEAGQDKSAFYERSARSLQKVGSKLGSWNAGGQHAAAIGRLKSQLDGICAKVDTADQQRATCEALIKAPPKKS